VGREDDLALSLPGHPVDLAVGARRDEQPALAVEGQGPDVLVGGVVVDLGLAPALVSDDVDLAVGRARRVQVALRTHGDGVDLELLGVEGDARLATLDAEDLSVVAGSGEHGSVGIGGEAPDHEALGVVEQAGLRRQPDLPVGVHGQPLGLAGEEVARSLDPPELGLGGEERRRGDRRGEGEAHDEAARHGTSRSQGRGSGLTSRR
jgi:hypothetical protein